MRRGNVVKPVSARAALRTLRIRVRLDAEAVEEVRFTRARRVGERLWGSSRAGGRRPERRRRARGRQRSGWWGSRHLGRRPGDHALLRQNGYFGIAFTVKLVLTPS